MKKILSFMFAVLMCLSAFPVRAAAAGEEVALGQKSRVNLSTASENGWRIEPATEEEIARAIVANKGIPYEEAFSEVVSKRKSRAQYDNFRIYNIYEVAIDEPNVTLTSFTHNVYVKCWESLTPGLLPLMKLRSYLDTIAGIPAHRPQFLSLGRQATNI